MRLACQGLLGAIQKRLIEHRHFDRWFSEVKMSVMAAITRLPEDNPVVLVFFCNSGRHRSVAAAEILHTILQDCAWTPLVAALAYLKR